MKKIAAPAKVGKVKPAYKIGDVVEVKGGGPPMTVSEVSGSTVSCQWYNCAECRFSGDAFPAAMLKRSGANKGEAKQPVGAFNFTIAEVFTNGDGEKVVRFGFHERGRPMVWDVPVHVETLLLKLGEHPTGGPALAEVFEAMKAEEG